MTGRHRQPELPCHARLLEWFLNRISPDIELWRQWPDDDNLDTITDKEENPK